MRNKRRVLKKIQRKNKKPALRILIMVVIVILIMIGIYNIPSVHERLAWRFSSLRSSILYMLKPPEQAVFNPTQQEAMNALVASSLTAMAPTSTPTPTITPTEMLTPTPTRTPQPTITPTPVPEAVQLNGVVHEYQKGNNCGPTNLSMALSFWGMNVNQMDIAGVLKPNQKDRNVMPYEMVDYVINHTEYGAVLRYGGDVDMLKHLIAGGFPVLIERGFDVAGKGWMGHYGVVTGYDDVTQKFRIPDSYEGPRTISYDELYLYWGHFDYMYVVVYPYDRESEVMSILGPNADEAYNLAKAAEEASGRIYDASDRELFFAWYSRGSILAQMDDYYGAALAYDEAFQVYSELPEDKMKRPWRITWYQTGPYYAYYYTGRYYDVINLADQTIAGQQLFGFDFEPAFEETWVWRGRAKLMLGDTSGAIADFQEALKWHPDWWVAENELIMLGIEP
jgi:hypothetical protein